MTVAAVVAPALAEERAIVKGLFDAEMWKTDSGSRLLNKNEGDPALQGRLRLWAAGDFNLRLQGFVLGEIEGGQASEQGETEIDIEQTFLRYSFPSPLRLVLEAGKFATPLGSFSKRYFSNINPLIGTPGSYDVSYPLGIKASGSAARFDYWAAVIDLPLSNEKYVPEPSRAPRPALGAGVTPIIGMRLGAYFTQGPYLNRDLGPMLPPGAGWKDYRQKIMGFEVQYSRGYFEVNSEFTLSGYDVPTRSEAVWGKAYYIEPKYTWSPRFFTALRLEKNDYAYVKPLSSTFWLARTVNYYDVEAGLGYRLGSGTVLKAAYRRDLWTVEESLKPFFPDGYSVSVQLSYSFDVNSWVERPR